MARAALAVQNASRAANIDFTAATVDGHAFNNASGKVLLIVDNGGGVSTTITIDVPLSVDGLAVPNLTVSIPAGELYVFPAFSKSVYNQDSAVPDIAEAVLVNAAPQASVTYAAVLPQ